MNPSVVISFAVLTILSSATLISRSIAIFYSSPELERVWSRIKSWWFIALIPLACLHVGWQAVAALFTLVAAVASFEFVQLTRVSNSRFTVYSGLVLIWFSLALVPMLKRFEPLFFLLSLTFANDVFQYLTGKAFGRRKLAPRISPSKTIEGFFGGVIAITVIGGVLGHYLMQISYPTSFAVSTGLAVAGTLGDLSISVLKRRAGVRDTGRLLPGHGGLLDRVDSLLLTSPYFVFIYFFFIERWGP